MSLPGSTKNLQNSFLTVNTPKSQQQKPLDAGQKEQKKERNGKKKEEKTANGGRNKEKRISFFDNEYPNSQKPLDAG